MFSDRSLPFSSRPVVLAVGDMARFPNQLKVLGPSDEGSLRMGDEGCPNESASVDDATGYSVDDATGYSREEEDVEAMTGEEVS